MYIVFSLLKFGKFMTKLYLFVCFVLDETSYKKEELNNCKLIEDFMNHMELLTKKRHLEKQNLNYDDNAYYRKYSIVLNCSNFAETFL